jgi:DNA topoisomerase-1
LRGGRFGTYLQLGEQAQVEKRPKGSKGPKPPPPEQPKRASLPKGVQPEDIDLEKALALLSLPREVGISPEDGEPILAGVGRFGPYVKHGKIYASLEEGDDVLTVGLNRAMHLIADKIANPKKGRRFGAAAGKTLGDHPDKGGSIVVKNGRFGPYVSNNGINATLPADKTPETLTLDEAIVLLDARAAAVGNSPRGKKAAPKKAAASKATKGKAKVEDDTPEIGDEAAARPAARSAKSATRPASARKKPAAKAKKPAAKKPGGKTKKATAAE